MTRGTFATFFDVFLTTFAALAKSLSAPCAVFGPDGGQYKGLTEGSIRKRYLVNCTTWLRSQHALKYHLYFGDICITRVILIFAQFAMTQKLPSAKPGNFVDFGELVYSLQTRRLKFCGLRWTRLLFANKYTLKFCGLRWTCASIISKQVLADVLWALESPSIICKQVC